MAVECTADALAELSRCFTGLNPRQQDAIEVYLLCQIANGTPTPPPPGTQIAEMTGDTDYALTAESSTGFYATQDDSLAITTHVSGVAALITAGAFARVWPCVSLADSTNSGDLTLLTATNTSLTSLDLTLATAMLSVDVNTNLLDQFAVGAILVALDNSGQINGSVNTTGNNPPFGAGAAVANLIFKGWTVATD